MYKIVLFMLIVNTAFAQEPSMVLVDRNKVSQMIHEVQLGRACDTLRQELEKEVALGVNAMVKADSVIEIQKRQIAFRDEAEKIQTERIINQQKANGELKKELRQQKRMTIAVGVIGLIALLIAL